MLAPLGLILVLAASQAADAPRAVARQAVAAVEGDSVPVVRSRWARNAAREPPDRLALLGLATLARLGYDQGAADSLYGRLLHTDAADSVAVYAAIGRGLAARSRGAHRDAGAWFDRATAAADRWGHRAARAEARLHAAAARARTSGPNVADSLYREAGALAAGDAQLEALHACGRAEVLALSFRPAAEEARRGAALAERAGDGRLRAHCLHLAAADLMRQGNLSAAAAQFAAAAALRRQLHDRSGLASTLQWRGAALNMAGWLQAASRDLEEAVAEARASGNGSAEAWALNNLGSVSISVGDAAAATVYADSAARRFAAQGDRYGEAGPHLARAAVALAAGQLDRAHDAYARAAALYEPLGFAVGLLISHMGLAHVAMRRGDWAAAESHLAAAERAGGAGGQEAMLRGLRYHRATLELRRGRFDAARALLASQLRDVRETARRYPHAAQPNWEYFDATRLAEVSVHLGDLRQAEALALEAAEALDRWRAGLTRRELRLQAYQVSEDLSDPDLGTATVIAALVRGGRLESAYQLAEQLRARELLDRLARADGLAAADADRDTTASGSPLTRAAPRADIARALPDSTALLEFVTGRGGEPTTVFVLTRDTLDARVVSPVDSLEPLIERFATLLEAGGDPRSLARQIGARLLDPVLATLPEGVTRLVVVPDGALHRLPFDAVTLPDGRFLIERFTMGLTPSATVFTRLRPRPRTPGGDVRILAFGDPARGSAPSDPAAIRAGPRFDSLPRLPASRREARLVARFAPHGAVRVGRRASESWLKQADLSPYRVLHFATHARADAATLAGTAIALAPSDGEDGVVGAGELGRLRLAADLVVLSACHSGGGVVVRGEGIVGLAAPLIAAGARAVTLTRWAISDRETVAFIRRFYEALAEGAGADEALRTAKLDALARGAPPAAWAAFAVIGDPTAVVGLQPPRAGRWGWLSILAAGVLLGGWLGWRRALRR